MDSGSNLFNPFVTHCPQRAAWERLVTRRRVKGGRPKSQDGSLRNPGWGSCRAGALASEVDAILTICALPTVFHPEHESGHCAQTSHMSQVYRPPTQRFRGDLT